MNIYQRLKPLKNDLTFRPITPPIIMHCYKTLLCACLIITSPVYSAAKKKSSSQRAKIHSLKINLPEDFKISSSANIKQTILAMKPFWLQDKKTDVFKVYTNQFSPQTAIILASFNAGYDKSLWKKIVSELTKQKLAQNSERVENLLKKRDKNKRKYLLRLTRTVSGVQIKKIVSIFGSPKQTIILAAIFPGNINIAQQRRLERTIKNASW